MRPAPKDYAEAAPGYSAVFVDRCKRTLVWHVWTRAVVGWRLEEDSAEPITVEPGGNTLMWAIRHPSGRVESSEDNRSWDSLTAFLNWLREDIAPERMKFLG